ncbi:MAG: polysaccharide pyruvyl transferase family protein, partial [Desulfitobacteriaceae bacterium]
MKVGIVTFHASHNYGAMLQAYALKKEVERLGCDCGVINYKNDKVVKDYAIFKFNLSVGFKSQMSSWMNVFAYRSIKQRWNKFEKFAAEQFCLTDRYTTVEEVQKANLEFNALICGSDQVWNPEGRADAVYMLDFCNNINIRRISYAPSFGKGLIPRERLEEYKKNIMKIDFISVREATGANIIKELTERSAKVVADPVLFLSKTDWDNSFRGMKIAQPYILCYFLSLPEGIQKTIDHLKKLTNYKVVLILDGYYSKISADIII